MKNYKNLKKKERTKELVKSKKRALDKFFTTVKKICNYVKN